MFGLETLDIAVGVVFVYLMLGLVTSACAEMLVQKRRLRGRQLEEAIRGLLRSNNETGIAEQLFDHPSIKALSRGSRPPSYLPARRFTLALLDILDHAYPEKSPPGAAAPKAWTVERLHEAVDALGKEQDEGKQALARSLRMLLRYSGDSLENALNEIERWYDETMDRVTGWFKRKLRIVLVVIAAIVVVLSNADTLQIVDVLTKNPAVKDAFVEQAGLIGPVDAADGENDTLQTPHDGDRAEGDGNDDPKQAQPAPVTPGGVPWDELDRIKPVLGWTKDAFYSLGTFPGFLSKLAGLLISTVCVSLGAPFWFDALQKLLRIRNSIKPKSSTETA